MDDPKTFVLAVCAFVIVATVLVWAASGAFGAVATRTTAPQGKAQSCADLAAMPRHNAPTGKELG